MKSHPFAVPAKDASWTSKLVIMAHHVDLEAKLQVAERWHQESTTYHPAEQGIPQKG
jgi:hypothetical protein